MQPITNETDADTSVFRPENNDTDTEFKIPYYLVYKVTA